MNYRLQNILHTFILLAGMLCLLSLVGWVVAGAAGISWALIIGIFAIMSASRFSHHILLYLYRARPMSGERYRPLIEITHWLAQRSQLPHTPRLFHLPTHNMVAFSTGQDKNSAIAISDGLLRVLDNRELIGVLAHELSHIGSRDLWVMAIADVISRMTYLMAVSGYILLAFYLPVYLVQGHEPPWLLLILLMLAPSLSAIMQLALSRTREFNADMSAVNLTGDPQGLISALDKIDQYEKNLLKRLLIPQAKQPHPSLLRTHPLTEERIQRLQQMPQTYQHPYLETDHVFHDPRFEPGHSPRHHISGLWY